MKKNCLFEENHKKEKRREEKRRERMSYPKRINACHFEQKSGEEKTLNRIGSKHPHFTNSIRNFLPPIKLEF
jgi:hypothetical protein